MRTHSHINYRNATEQRSPWTQSEYGIAVRITMLCVDRFIQRMSNSSNVVHPTLLPPITVFIFTLVLYVGATHSTSSNPCQSIRETNRR